MTHVVERFGWLRVVARLAVVLGFLLLLVGAAMLVFGVLGLATAISQSARDRNPFALALGLPGLGLIGTGFGCLVSGVLWAGFGGGVLCLIAIEHSNRQLLAATELLGNHARSGGIHDVAHLSPART